MSINLQNMKLGRGHEFNPKDQDAIFFLNQRVSGRPLGERLILELDPYDVKQLPDIFSATDKLGSLYFFTKLRRKSTIKHSSTNIDRTVRDKKTKVVVGNWHADSKPIQIKDGCRKEVIGKSRKLSYRPAKGTAAAADSSRNCNRYIMTEYLLPCGGTNYDIFKDGVLCRLVKSNRCKDGDDFPSEEEVEATPSETLAASEDSDDREILEDSDGDEELLDNPATNSGSPMAADSPHAYEVEAPTINNLQLEYSIPAALEILPLQTLVDVDPHAGDSQVMDYYSYAAEVEATPNPVDDLPVLSTAVEIPPLHDELFNGVEENWTSQLSQFTPPHDIFDFGIPPPHNIFDFEDGNEESYMASMNFEDVCQMIDWRMEPLVGEEYSTEVEIPPLDQTQVASMN